MTYNHYPEKNSSPFPRLAAHTKITRERLTDLSSQQVMWQSSMTGRTELLLEVPQRNGRKFS